MSNSTKKNRHLFFVLLVLCFSIFGLATTRASVLDSLILSPFNINGAQYIAPTDGMYQFTITGGAYSRFPNDDITYGTYWNNCIHIFYNRPVEWIYNPDADDYGPDAFDYYL